MNLALKIVLIFVAAFIISGFFDGFEAIKLILHNLFSPTWKKNHLFGDRDEFKRRQLAAVDALSDPKELKRAALEATDDEIRKVAVARIDDPEVLIAFALKDENEEVRRAAEDRLSML